MRDPYENILIGNFLYSLGLVIGSRFPDKEIHSVVNLLQQTPLDGPLADVHLRYPGVVRLIEFKRASNTSDKESRKLTVLKMALDKEPELKKVSRVIHWYVESSEAPLSWQTKVCPYLDLEDNLDTHSTLQCFIQSLADTVADARTNEVSDELLQLYLTAVGTFSGKSSSSSGVLVSIGKDGVLRYIALENIHDLRHELRLHKKLAHELSTRVAHERSLEHKPPSRGMSYG